MDAVKAAWLSLVPRFPIAYEQFQEFVKGCEVHPISVDGEMVGALIVKGPELHACVLPEYRGRWLSRKELRVMNRLIDQYGYAETTATTEEGEHFVQRLGFEQHGTKFRRSTKWAWKH